MGDDGARLARIEARLRVLEDEREILATLSAYGHAIDYGDERAFLDCWSETAVLRWPWRAPIEGRAAIAAAFRAHTHAPEAYHKHMLMEPRITVAGDAATADSYYARMDRDDEGRPVLRSFGRYRDRLGRGPDGRWRFVERIAENEAHIAPPRKG
ncbi:MAG TPA: nuclear transport factor 2 family protein [Baekduia sp.]